MWLIGPRNRGFGDVLASERSWPFNLQKIKAKGFDHKATNVI